MSYVNSYDGTYHEKYVLDIETIAEDDSSIYILSDGINFSRSNSSEDKSLSDTQKALDKMKSNLALSPVTGRVICIGLYEISTGATYQYVDKNELSILVDANNILSRKDIKIITYNGERFDIPFLIYRYLKYGAYVPYSISYHNLDKIRYNDMFNVMRKISLTDNLHHKLDMISLKKWNKIFNLVEKVDTYTPQELEEAFLNSNYSIIYEHNLNDMLITGKLYGKFRPDMY